MKYTRSESGAVIEVKGCTSCPHMVPETEHGFTVMFCTFTPKGVRKRHVKLIGKWTGAYHDSCPLRSEAQQAPEVVK